MKRGIGVDILTPDSFLTQELETFSYWNTDLIKNVPEVYKQQVQNATMAGLQQGQTTSQIAKSIMKEGSVTKRRAELIARDQVSKLNGQLTQLRQAEAGVEKYIWRTSQDERVRSSHAAREGKEFSWSEIPDGGHPGEAINCRCLLPYEVIFPLGFCEKIYRREFSGTVVSLLFSDGSLYSVTPNHPIFVNGEFVAAEKINIGQDVFNIMNQGLDAFSQDNNATAMGIENIFHALAPYFGNVETLRVKHDFHGDGTKQKVDFISLKADLPFELKPKTIECFRELILPSTDKGIVNFHVGGGSFLELYLPNYFSALQAVPRTLSNSLSALFTGKAPSGQSGLLFCGWLNSLIDQAPFNDCSADLKLLRDFVNAEPSIEKRDYLSAQVLNFICGAINVRVLGGDDASMPEFYAQGVGIASHNIADIYKSFPRKENSLTLVKKTFSEFSGHVYNLQTSTRLYLSESGVVNHNCSAEPILEI
jgi:SPP1 gp7 family putative phage head morphogenesis protein